MIYALAAAAEDASRRRRNYACKYSLLRNVQEPGDKTTSERGGASGGVLNPPLAVAWA